MAKTVSTKLEDDLAERAKAMAEKYGVTLPHLLRDAIENFLPYTDVPGEFIEKSGLLHVLKKDIPLRTILPFTSSMLGFTIKGDFLISINGHDVVINPFPERSMLCGIKIIERLYQALKVEEIKRDEGA